jgi:hypothetical protein
MKATLLFTAMACLGLLCPARAQVGVGTNSPANSAALEVKATDKGLLPPRMTEAERDAINNPAAGLQIWCSNCGSNGEMQVYNGSNWTNMIGGAASDPPPQVGDFRDGGVVFYVAPSPTDLDGDGNDDQGLVCAISDQSSGAEWGCYLTGISGAGGNGIGSGADNTSDILADCSQSGIAAKLCDDYTGGGYNDWLLPSKDELDEMYQNKATINATAGANGGSSFASAYYWSSTEYSISWAWAQYFFNGSQKYFNYDKNLTLRVRAVRAF